MNDGRLQRLLGGLELAPLRARLRGRFASQRSDEPITLMRLEKLSLTERAALAALVGRPAKASASIALDVGEVDRMLGDAGLATSLKDALEQLDGPIVHLASARALEQERWTSVVRGCTSAATKVWIGAPANLGLVKRLCAGNPESAIRLLGRVENVLAKLPAHGIPRAQLAAMVLGDAHALDDGKPEATLVLAVLRTGREAPLVVDEEIDSRARTIWAEVGVLVNELARPALLLNVPCSDAGIGLQPGEPGFLSLRKLVRTAPAWDVRGRTIYVCENPNVVAIAADVLGGRCAPLICTDGMPAAAQRTLLAQLASSGGRLMYHGDFDWPGLRIANHVIRTHSALPWRMDAMTYRLLVADAQSPLALGGPSERCEWDSELTAAMIDAGTAIAEEAAMGELLEDLSTRNLKL